MGYFPANFAVKKRMKAKKFVKNVRRMSDMCGFIPYQCSAEGCDSWVSVYGCLSCSKEGENDE